MARVLYISYDGILEPLGQSQIIPYLKRLAFDNEIHIISFEKPADLVLNQVIEDIRLKLKSHGINWTPMRYHKRLSIVATIYDIIRGQINAIRITKIMKTEIVHVRSYIPALIALPLKWFSKTKILFDIRGFWADERVDGKIWPKNGIVYKSIKFLERYLFRAADHVVTLTDASVPKIIDFGYWKNNIPNITVIPTCVDLERFKPPQIKLTDNKSFIFGYVGSFGTWYMMDETMALFSEILKIRPKARMIILNHNEHDAIRSSILRSGLPIDKVEIKKSSYEEVAVQLQRIHAASALIRPCFSKIASAPTKVAEYLACAIPCIGNYGVGDMEKTLENNEIGVILRSFDINSLNKAAKKIIMLSSNPDVRNRCRKIAEDHFSLDKAVKTYKSIYLSLLSKQQREAFINE